MLKLAGACLLIAGSTGFGFCIWRDLDKRAAQLKLLERTFIMLASEAGYSRLPLPDGLLRIGGRLEGALVESLRRVGLRVRAEPGVTLKEAWRELMPQYLAQTCLEEKEKRLVLTFPEYTGFSDGNMQLTALEQFSGELGQAAKTARQDADNGKKTILSVSAAGGLLLAILLF